jgi:hypothetical protein
MIDTIKMIENEDEAPAVLVGFYPSIQDKMDERERGG